MKYLPWIIALALSLILIFVIMKSVKSSYMVFDNGIMIDTYADGNDFVKTVQIVGVGEVKKFTLLVNGKAITALKVCESLRKCNNEIGNEQFKSGQVSNGDWTLTSNKDGDIEWMAFTPKSSVKFLIRGVEFSGDETIFEMCKKLGIDKDKISKNRHWAIWGDS